MALNLQCVRVDRFFERKGVDPELPNILDGSRTTPCCVCRQRVWLSRVAVLLARTMTVNPVCDSCHPAKQVVIRDPYGNGKS